MLLAFALLLCCSFIYHNDRSTSEPQIGWIDDGVAIASLASAPVAPVPAVITLSQNLGKRLTATVQANVYVHFLDRVWLDRVNHVIQVPIVSAL